MKGIARGEDIFLGMEPEETPSPPWELAWDLEVKPQWNHPTSTWAQHSSYSGNHPEIRELKEKLMSINSAVDLP